MESYEVVLKSGCETISGADCYQQEGPMTTFFRFGDNRNRVDPWSKRVASFRTAEINAIRSIAAPNMVKPVKAEMLEIVA